jgi:hypothetical protein
VHERACGATSAQVVDRQIQDLGMQNGGSFEMLSGGGCPRENEDARADDRADAQRRQRPGAERLFQAMLGLLGFGDQPVDGLAAEKLTRGSAPARFLV